MRDDGYLDQDGNGRGGTSWLDLGYILQIYPTRFLDEFGVGYEKDVLGMTASF